MKSDDNSREEYFFSGGRRAVAVKLGNQGFGYHITSKHYRLVDDVSLREFWSDKLLFQFSKFLSLFHCCWHFLDG